MWSLSASEYIYSYTDSYSMLAILISPTTFLKTRVAYTKLFHQNLFLKLE